MRWPHFPIVHLLTELILGYLLYWFLGFNPVLLIVITALLLLFWIGSLFMGQLSQAIRSMGLHVLMLGVFYLSCSAYYQPSKNHFTSIEHPQSKLPVVVELIEKLNAPPGQQPYYARLIQQGNQPFSGTIVVHFKRLKDTKDFPLGSYFGTHQYPKAVAPPKHPGQFDYKAYLQQQKIDGELTLYPKGYWFSGKNPNPSLLIRMRNWRQQGLASLAQSPLSEASEGLLGALVFGERSGLEDK
ncbi:MAG: DUF4131 domain-containing protein [Flavobacteriaceae bacterium]